MVYLRDLPHYHVSTPSVVQPTRFASVGFTLSKCRTGLLQMTVFCFTDIPWFSLPLFEADSLINKDCHLYKL